MKVTKLMKVFLAFMLAITSLMATASSDETPNPDRRWVGIMAVMESPLVNQIIEENGNKPAVYYSVLRKALDSGKIQSAPGGYCVIPYNKGKPADKPECFVSKTGVYTLSAPAYMVQDGRAMCAQVPDTWPAIAGQKLYPKNGGPLENCYDFGKEAADAKFAATRSTAAMIVLVKPADANMSTGNGQEPRFLNGELNLSTKTFDWNNGGGDPLWKTWQQDGFRKTLAIPRLNLDEETQAGLRKTLLGKPFERIDLKSLYEGKVVGDVMVSGKEGWIAVKPRLVSSEWKKDRSTMASWWTWTNPKTGERWQIIVADVCGNLVLKRLGRAVECVCGPNDACVK